MAALLADNRGPGLNISMWIIIVPTVMMVAAKVYTKWYTAKKIMVDDILIIIALLTAIAQSIAITEEVEFGLGRREDTLSSGDMNKLLIAQYISNIFYVISIYAAKLSTAYYFVTCLCKAFWTVSLVVDVITQAMIALLPICLLRGLHMSKKPDKWLVMVVFATNLIVIPLSILRAIFLLHAMDSSDFTWESFKFGILTSFQSFVSIMVTSMPFVKPFLDSLILQPYLIAVEEPQSIIPGNPKVTSWAQRIQESRVSRSQKPPWGSKSYGSQKNSSVHWPYIQRQENDSVDLAMG